MKTNLLHFPASTLFILVGGLLFAGGACLHAQSFVFAMSDPYAGATEIDPNKPLVFSFTAVMKPAGSVVWSDNVDSSKIIYSWSEDAMTLTCSYPPGWPGSSTIEWELDPSQFIAADGTPLIAPMNGMFKTTTGSSSGTTPTGPCDQSNRNSNQGTFVVAKSLQYSQSSALNSAPTAAKAGTFSTAFIASPTVKVSSVFLKGPEGTRQEMLGYLSQTFVLSGNTTYTSQADLDAAYPDGTYEFQWQLDATGALAATDLSLPTSGYPPSPYVVNFDQTQNVDFSSDFTLQFSPLTGATTNDVVSFTISNDSGVVFQDPDACVPRTLAPTAASLTIPAGTLSSNKVYQASLSFMRVTDRQSPAALGAVGLATASKTLQFNIRTAGPAPAGPAKFTLEERLSGGSFRFQLSGQANASYQVETSTDLQTWKPLVTTNSANGIINFTDPGAIQSKAGFYRAKAGSQ